MAAAPSAGGGHGEGEGVGSGEELGVTKELGVTEVAEGEGEDEADEDAPEEAELDRLFEALREGDQGVIDELLLGDEEHPPMTGFGVDSAFEAGMTPLHWLTVEGHASVAQWLIDEVQADVDTRDVRLQTPLHHAAVKGHATLAQLLLHRGADPMSRDVAGWTPLHAAARSGFTDAVHELLAHTGPGAAAVAMLNCRGADGDTPLHRAAYWGHASMAALLLERGALSSQANDAGLRPFDMICEGGERRLDMPTLSKMLCAPRPAA